MAPLGLNEILTLLIIFGIPLAIVVFVLRLSKRRHDD